MIGVEPSDVVAARDWTVAGYLIDLRHEFKRRRIAYGQSIRGVAYDTGLAASTVLDFETGKHELALPRVVRLVQWLAEQEEKR